MRRTSTETRQLVRRAVVTPGEIRERAEAVLALLRSPVDDGEKSVRLMGLWAGVSSDDSERIVQVVAKRAAQDGDLEVVAATLDALQNAAVSGPSRFAMNWIQSAGRNQITGVWPHMT